MNLNKTPYSAISDAFTERSSTGREQTFCNTHFHTHSEISAVLPNIGHLSPDPVQPWVLLEPWLDIITSSQRLRDEDVHRIRLPGPLLALLISASEVGIYMGRVTTSDAEDLEECFPRTTTRGLPLSQLFERGKYFPRLNTCSLKDAADGGQGAVTSAKQLWTRLVTSARACNGIRSILAFDDSAPIHLYLFPWNEGMRTELEYRVFCPPEMGRIAAISQYQWHEPWVHAEKEGIEQRDLAERIWKAAEEIYGRLMAHPAMTERMRSMRFTFDVREDVEGGDRLMLIKLNDFGAMSGCGACLYHWIRDARVLYGLEEKAEFRVAV